MGGQGQTASRAKALGLAVEGPYCLHYLEPVENAKLGSWMESLACSCRRESSSAWSPVQSSCKCLLLVETGESSWCALPLPAGRLSRQRLGLCLQALHLLLLVARCGCNISCVTSYGAFCSCATFTGPAHSSSLKAVRVVLSMRLSCQLELVNFSADLMRVVCRERKAAVVA